MKSSRQYSFYQFMLWLLKPYAASTAKKLDRQFLRNQWKERFGEYLRYRATEDQPILIHAASAGEARSAGVMMNELRALGYDGHFIVTTTTPMGIDGIEPFLQDGDQQFYAPYDREPVVKKALDTFKPRLLIVMEGEIWPAFWLECHTRNIPVVLANARLSQEQLQKYQERMHDIWKAAVQGARLILPQTEQIAERFKRIGAGEEQTQVLGNLKFNQPVDETSDDKVASLKHLLGPGRPVWLAANTQPGEEYLALQTHAALLEKIPDLLLVIIPSNEKRFTEVASGCEANNENLQVRSDDLNAPILLETQVYLADTLGETADFYRAVDLCCLGGSFSSFGGHNIIEPTTYRCPTIVGPMMQNYEDIVDVFLDQGALIQVKDPEELESTLEELLNSEESRQKLVQRANEVLQQHQGAGKVQAERIYQLLDQ